MALTIGLFLILVNWLGWAFVKVANIALDTKKWAAGLPRDRFPMHHPYRTPHFNYYENKIIVPAYNELKLIDKTSGDVTAKVKVDKSDYISAHNHDCHG